MSLKFDKAKQMKEKCQTVLADLLRDEDNKYCVDCDSKGPRWASWNLGVFLCIRCAGIHRNLGVHISKVKSVNLDEWTPEQVVSLQQMGNSRARAVYEANLPDNFRRPQNDSGLETFIRAKYEHKKYIAREWVPPPMPKVNWEKEIEDEIDRQKRKKKTLVEKKSLGNVEVPQLPKPKNHSPKPGRAVGSSVPTTVATNTTPNVESSKQSTDLLGLQNGEDNFSSFLSAPSNVEKKEESKDASKLEEENFFNQTAPTEKEKVKLTKDSILALYSNAPQISNFNANYQQPNFGTFPTQQNFQNFSQFPQQNYHTAQNGVPAFTANNQMQQFSMTTVPSPQFNLGNQFSSGGIPPQNLPYQQVPQMSQFQSVQSLAQIPVPAASTQFQSLPNQFGPGVQFPQQHAGFPGGAVSNPCFGATPTNNLQQQFHSLSMSSQRGGNQPPTLATTNVWQ